MSKRDDDARCGRATRRGWRLLAPLACVLVVAATPARADDDLPGRVGRVAIVQGEVLRAPAGSAGEWSEIGLNYPIAEGDNLRVEAEGRVEVDYGGGQFRLAGDTSLHVSRLDDRQLALFVAAGRVIVRVRVLDNDDSVRVDTPASQIALARPGLYRIDVAADSPRTTVVVREGEAQVATVAGSEQVFPGQSAYLSGVANEQAEIREGIGIDGFDAWSAARDRVYEAPRQHAYVSRQMIGQADLDRYGTWQTYPEYGAVWFPTSVAPDWAPYRFGRWTWLPGWGYTWVDDAPWGYAPFHYGRWAHVGGRWGWCPGAFVARPSWAPALVAWYGGAGWSHSAAHGAPVYGWVPLGWREPFVPWWGRCASSCWTRYNRPYGVNVAERRDAPAHYVNWNAPGGLTAVTGTALASAQPVADHRVPIASNVAFAPSLVTRPPPGGPVDAVLPSRRTDTRAPAAPTLPFARTPAPLAVPTPPLARFPAPTPASPNAATAPVMPRALPVEPATRAAMPAMPIQRTVPPAAVAAPVIRGAPPAAVAAPVIRGAPPAAPSERTFRTAPLPPPTAPPPAVIRAPAPPVPAVAPAFAPHAAPVAPQLRPPPPAPAVVPAPPPAVVPGPPPGAVAPRAPVRAVPNPGQDRPN